MADQVEQTVQAEPAATETDTVQDSTKVEVPVVKAAPPTRESVIQAEKMKVLREKAENKEEIALAKAFKKAQEAAKAGDIDELLKFAEIPTDKAASYIKKKSQPQDKVAVLDDKVSQLQAQIHKQEQERQALAEKQAHEQALQLLEEAKAEIPWVLALQGGKDEAISYIRTHEKETGERITLLEAAKAVNERFKSGMAEQIEEIMSLPEGEAMFKKALEKIAAKSASAAPADQKTPTEQAAETLTNAVKPPAQPANKAADGLNAEQKALKEYVKQKAEAEKAKKQATQQTQAAPVRNQEAIPAVQHKPKSTVNVSDWLKKKGYA